jgi:hypothetical protein
MVQCLINTAVSLTVCRALKDMTLPLSTPLTGIDGKQILSIPVPKGTPVYIAVAAANYNKYVWGDDALEFKPERYQNSKAGGGNEKMCGTYGNMMTFLGGGRSCMCVFSASSLSKSLMTRHLTSVDTNLQF